MNHVDIPIENLILIAVVFIALVVVATSNQKASPATLRRLLNDYSSFADRSNELIADVREIINRLRTRYFVSSEDEKNAVSLVEEYSRLCDTLFGYNEQISFYLKKRNVTYYRKYKKLAEATLQDIQKVLYALEDVEKYTQSEEEREYAERCRQERENAQRNYYQDDTNGDYDEYSDKAYDENTPVFSPQLSCDVFFVGCKTAEEVEMRYRSLAKVYHPDMPTGNKETFQQVLNEYERVRSYYEKT